MVNNKLFSSKSQLVQNEAGGLAYESSARHALAQIACTGYFQDTFYAKAEDILKTVQEKIAEVIKEPDGLTFIAKLAIYSREKAHMKDMPSFLCARLASNKKSHLLRKAFPRCINNAKQLRSFIQICRSMEINVSRRSIKNLVRQWFDSVSYMELLNSKVGNDPTIQDIIKMCHVKVKDPRKQEALKYLLGLTYNTDLLPEEFVQFENFKKGISKEVPLGLDFRLLDGCSTKDQLRSIWEKQAERRSWHTVRMNLNNFLKYGVFQTSRYTGLVCDTLTDVTNVKAMLYQVFTTYKNISQDMPFEVQQALHDCIDKSVDKVPEITGNLAICVDVSGSMSSPVSQNSKVTYIDIAALFACSILRRNPSAKLIPFDTAVRNVRIDPRDTILTNADKLAQLGGGGTYCSIALQHILNQPEMPDKIIFLSDNQSWVDISTSSNATEYQKKWKKILSKNPSCKLVCIDIAPYTTSQCKDRSNILKVGGFSDAVFDVVKEFLENSVEKDRWKTIIESISI